MLHLTRAQVREVDRIAIERYRIPGIVLMENAAIGVADVACEMLDNDCVGQVLIVCGGGNNGGDGLAVARHMSIRGADVTIALTVDPDQYQGDALVNWQIVRAMHLAVEPFGDSVLQRTKPLLIVDAIFGTGLQREPREPFAEQARIINAAHVPILSIDVPSGLDCDAGRPLGEVAVVATQTVTFVAEKVGFAEPGARAYLGEVTVADIGCPTEIVEQLVSGAGGDAGQINAPSGEPGGR
jgi:NAD(P)H-hydrate epimerase